jgi:hypothetical protein
MSDTQYFENSLNLKQYYPISYNFLLNTPTIITINLNTEPYIIDLSNNSISYFYIPKKYRIQKDTFEDDLSGNKIVKTYNCRTNELISTHIMNMSLSYNLYDIEGVKNSLININISNITLYRRTQRINILLNKYLNLYKELKDVLNFIKIKSIHHITNSNDLQIAIKNDKSIYLSLSIKKKNIEELNNYIINNMSSFLYDTINYLLRLKYSNDYNIWIKDNTLDKYLELLDKSYKSYSKRYNSIYYIISFSNDQFYYYSNVSKKFYKTSIIRICEDKKHNWTLHFGNDATYEYELNVEKVCEYFDTINIIRKLNPNKLS